MFWKKSTSAKYGTVDIAALSYLELKELRARIDAAMTQQFDTARSSFQRDFVEKMEEFGLSIDDFKPKRRKRTVAIKFRDPDNPENTWSGLGKPKKWLKEKLDQGQSIDEFSV